MLDRLLLREVQAELAEDLFVYVTVFDMRDVGVHHQRNQVQNEVGALAKDRERGKTEVLEACIVDRLDATHGVDHLFANFDWWREWLGVTAEDVTKINLKKVSGWPVRMRQMQYHGKSDLYAFSAITPYLHPYARTYHQVSAGGYPSGGLLLQASM